MDFTGSACFFHCPERTAGVSHPFSFFPCEFAYQALLFMPDTGAVGRPDGKRSSFLLKKRFCPVLFRFFFPRAVPFALEAAA